MLNSEDMDDLTSNLTQEKELRFNEMLRKQFEKFIMDLEMFNAGMEDKNLVNLLKKMDKFNEDLRENSQIVEMRYKEAAIETELFQEKINELEEQTKSQEQQLISQIEAKEEFAHELHLLESQAQETERQTTNFEINHNSREKELEKECDEMRMENNEMAKENDQLRSEVNQKFMEIDELKQEISSLNKNLESLMEMNMDEGTNEKFQEAVRTSIALGKKAETMAVREGSITSTKSVYHEKIEELESQLDQEREYVNTLKMEMLGLKNKIEELEDNMMSQGTFSMGGNRLDSDMMRSGFEVDDDMLDRGMEDSLMDIGKRNASIVRKVRDHKNIQVDLIMANVIQEADEEEEPEFSIQNLVLERKEEDGSFRAKIKVLEDGQAKMVNLLNDKIQVYGLENMIQKVEVEKKPAVNDEPVVKEVVREVDKIVFKEIDVKKYEDEINDLKSTVLNLEKDLIDVTELKKEDENNVELEEQSNQIADELKQKVKELSKKLKDLSAQKIVQIEPLEIEVDEEENTVVGNLDEDEVAGSESDGEEETTGDSTEEQVVDKDAENEILLKQIEALKEILERTKVVQPPAPEIVEIEQQEEAVEPITTSTEVQTKPLEESVIVKNDVAEQNFEIENLVVEKSDSTDNVEYTAQIRVIEHGQSKLYNLKNAQIEIYGVDHPPKQPEIVPVESNAEELQQHLDKISTLEASLKALETTLQLAKDSKSELETSNKDLLTQIESLNLQLATPVEEKVAEETPLPIINQEELDELKNKIAANEEEIQSWKEQVTELESKSTSLQRELDYSQESLKDQKKNFLAKISEQEATIRELKGVPALPKQLPVISEDPAQDPEDLKKDLDKKEMKNNVCKSSSIITYLTLLFQWNS